MSQKAALDEKSLNKEAFRGPDGPVYPYEAVSIRDS